MIKKKLCGPRSQKLIQLEWLRCGMEWLPWLHPIQPHRVSFASFVVRVFLGWNCWINKAANYIQPTHTFQMQHIKKWKRKKKWKFFSLLFLKIFFSAIYSEGKKEKVSFYHKKSSISLSHYALINHPFEFRLVMSVCMCVYEGESIMH